MSLTISTKSSIWDVWLGFDYISAFFPGTLDIFLGKEVSQGRQLRELTNEFLQIFHETLPNKLLLLPKKVFI